MRSPLAPVTMTEELSRWATTVLGSAPVSEFFAARSMSTVHGVVLANGRRVAVKLRHASDRVLACAEAQRTARAAGIDCPELLAGPHLLADGAWASAEQWRDDGAIEPSGSAVVAYAELLHDLVVALAGLAPERFQPPPPWADFGHGVAGRVWPPAASLRWDPEGNVVPSWLGELAAVAQGRLAAARALPLVVGHSDLNGLNVRWTERPIVHDWDSLAALPEAVLAGIVAVNHVEAPGAGAIAEVERTAALLDHYQTYRRFTFAERELAWAAGVWVAAYNAAFEYLHGAPGRVCAQLERDAAERLALAGC